MLRWKRFSVSCNSKIDREEFYSRYYEWKLTSKHVWIDSSMADVEPKLVELIFRIGRICRCLTPTQSKGRW